MLQSVCYRVRWVWKGDVKYKSTIRSKTEHLYLSNIKKALKTEA